MIRSRRGDLADVNERLRANFEEFRLGQIEGGVAVLPVLRWDVVERYVDADSAVIVYPLDGGDPEPIMARGDPANEDWQAALHATGDDVIRPPARAFEVLAKPAAAGGRLVPFRQG